jgi:hypothetical protein
VGETYFDRAKPARFFKQSSCLWALDATCPASSPSPSPILSVSSRHFFSSLPTLPRLLARPSPSVCCLGRAYLTIKICLFYRTFRYTSYTLTTNPSDVPRPALRATVPGSRNRPTSPQQAVRRPAQLTLPITAHSLDCSFLRHSGQARRPDLGGGAVAGLNRSACYCTAPTLRLKLSSFHNENKHTCKYRSNRCIQGNSAPGYS